MYFPLYYRRIWYAQQDSNPQKRSRNPPVSPLAYGRVLMVGVTGLEPTTYTLKVYCATFAPHAHLVGRAEYDSTSIGYQPIALSFCAISPYKKPDGLRLCVSLRPQVYYIRSLTLLWPEHSLLNTERHIIGGRNEFLLPPKWYPQGDLNPTIKGL